MARKGRRAFGSVRQLASGRWQARYLDAAGVRHTAPRTFPTKVEATRYLAQVEADLLRGSWADPKLGRVTFGEWVERWRPTTASLRPGTLVLYDYLLRRFLLPAFAAVPLGRLDTMTIRAWLAELHRAGEVTPTTVAKAYRLLRRILNLAVEAGYLPRNPCTVKGAGSERAAEMRHASIPDLHRLADAVPGRYRALILLAGYGGLRWAELVGLRRRHVDLTGDWWTCWQTSRGGIEDIRTQPVHLDQHGELIQIEATARGRPVEEGGYLWRGELRLWDNEILMGWYAASDGSVRSKGTMYFVMHPHGIHATGRWVGLSYDGNIVTGWSSMARTEDEARELVGELKEQDAPSSR